MYKSSLVPHFDAFRKQRSTNYIHINKMSRHLLALLAILAILTTTGANLQPCCPPNEYWSPCDAACQPSCSNNHPICPKICMSGCRCNDGWVRDRFGVCIPLYQCFPLPCGQILRYF